MTTLIREKAIRASEAMRHGDIREAKELMQLTQDLTDDEYQEVMELVSRNGKIDGYSL